MLEPLATLSLLVRRGDPDKVLAPGEVRILWQDGAIVAHPRPKRFLSTPGPVEAWIVAPTPSTPIHATLRDVELVFPGGGSARVDVALDTLRVLPGSEDTLVTAIRGWRSLDGEFGRVLATMVAAGLAQQRTATPAAWRLVRGQLIEHLRAQLRDRLGLSTRHIAIAPHAPRGRHAYDHVALSLPVQGSDARQRFELSAVSDDEDDELPLPDIDDDEELRRIRGALAQATASFRTMDFFRRPGEVNQALRAIVAPELAAIRRVLDTLDLRPTTPEPSGQVNVDRTVSVPTGAGPLDVEVTALLTRNDASRAREFSVSGAGALPDALVTELRRLAERALVAVTLEDVRHSPVLEPIREQLAGWVTEHTGYLAHHLRLRVTTRVPEPPNVVRLRRRVDIDAGTPSAFAVELRATLRLDDDRAWLRGGSPDIERRAGDLLEEALLAAVHALDEAEAPIARAGLVDELTARLHADLREVGFRVDGAVLLDVGVPPGERKLLVSVVDEFPVPAADSRLRLDLTATLTVDDPWRFQLARAERTAGWAERQLRRAVADRLPFVDLGALRADIEPVRQAITERAGELVGLGGYHLDRLRIEGLDEFLRPPRQVVALSVALEVHVPGAGPVRMDARATIRLAHERVWREAGAPDVETRCRVAAYEVARGALVGAEHHAPRELGAQLRDALQARLGEEAGAVGYELRSCVVELEVPAEERTLALSWAGEGALTGRASPLPIEVAATLTADDPWSWWIAAAARAEGWKSTLIRDVVEATLATMDESGVRADTRGAESLAVAALEAAFQARGYRARVRLTGIRQLEPRVERLVTLTRIVALAVPGLAVVDVEARASLRLEDERRWASAGKPDVQVVAGNLLTEAATGALHAVVDASAPDALATLGARVGAALAEGLAPLGYRVEGVRAEPVVALEDRDKQVSLAEEFPVQGGAALQLRASAGLLLTDPWRYRLAAEARPTGWEVDQLRAAIGRELAFTAREAIRLHAARVAGLMEASFAAAAATRGYAVRRFTIEGLTLTPPPSSFRADFKVRLRLRSADEFVTWAGWAEARLESLPRWVEAGEPLLPASLEEYALTALGVALREREAGEVDERPREVEAVLEDELRGSLRQVGYELVGALGTVIADNTPPDSFELPVFVDCTVDQRKVKVKATVRVRRTSASRWRRAGHRSLAAWLEEITVASIRDLLLPLSYQDVLRDVIDGFEGRPTRIRKDLQTALDDRLKPVGYEVQQVLAFPDEEAGELLGGFKIQVDAAFPTAWAGKQVNLGIRATGRFTTLSDNPIRALLAKGASVTAWLQEEMLRAVEPALLQKTPNEVYFHWQGAAGTVHDGLVAEIARVLEGHGVADRAIQLTLQPPDYIEKVRGLRGGGPFPFTVSLPPRLHRGAHEYQGTFLVTGLEESGADNLFNRTDAPGEAVLATALGAYVAQLMAHRDEERILREERDDGDWTTILAEVTARGRNYCGAKFGLTVDITGLSRVAKDKEIVPRLIEDTEFHHRRVALEVQQAIVTRELKRITEGAEDPAAWVWQVTGDGPVGPGPTPFRPLIQEPPSTLTVDPPQSGYPSAEAGCQLHLSVRVKARGTAVEDQRDRLREAVRVVLSQVEPARFWLRFDDGTAEDPSVEARIRAALVAALDDGGTVDEVTPPAGEHRARLLALTSRDFATPGVEVEIDRGRAKATVSARFGDLAPAGGRWRRFEVSRPGPEGVVRWAAEWLARRPKAGIDLGAAGVEALRDGFDTDFRAEFGLTATLRLIEVNRQDADDRQKLRDKLTRLEDEIEKLSHREDNVSNRRSLEQKRKEHEDMAARLARQGLVDAERRDQKEHETQRVDGSSDAG